MARGSQCKSGRFPLLDSHESIRRTKKLHFHSVRAISHEPPQTCDSQVLVPRSLIRQKRVQFRNSETTRENKAIRANLRIDSCESDHLSYDFFSLTNPSGPIEVIFCREVKIAAGSIFTAQETSQGTLWLHCLRLWRG